MAVVDTWGEAPQGVDDKTIRRNKARNIHSESEFSNILTEGFLRS
jgi:hypothetical protein